MYKLKTPDIYASEIAGFLNAKLNGDDFIVRHPASVNTLRNNSFLCLIDDDKISEDKINKHKDVLIITSKKIRVDKNCASYIVVNMPKVSFMKVINEFYVEFDPVQIADSAKIDKEARIGRGVFIGEYSIIGPEVVIGNNTKILNNVVISGNVKIGNNCLIKDNTTIGSEGFDFVRDEDNLLVHSPQIGEIHIGDNVWIGANSAIENSIVDQTIIEDNVKIDDLVQIGGNSIIQKNSLITAGVIVNRNVRIGKNCVLFPNVSVGESVSIGNNVTVGIGSVVIKNLKDNYVYVGNPAKLLRQRKEGEEVL